MPADRIPEAVLSRVWNDGWHNREMRTTDGIRVGVVYRGVWTHSNGPDYRDAMLEIDGKLVHGAVELHVRASDWHDHGHHQDPAYDDVILHVVLDDNTDEPAHGPSGRPIPTIWIGPYLSGPIETFLVDTVPTGLGDVGARTCLPTLAGARPELVANALRREGWRRMQEKQLRVQQELLIRTPGEVLYRVILDSLGLSANRGGMECVADALPLHIAERISGRCGSTSMLAALLGVAGFLPLAPAHQSLLGDTASPAGIEREWQRIARDHMLEPLPPSIWNLNRVRPLNHPVRRLASMASLLAASAMDGLLPTVLDLPLDGGTSWGAWLDRAEPAIGASRRRQIIVNALAPFVAAFAEVTGDQALLERAGGNLERLPDSVDDEVARRTKRQIAGHQRLLIRTALEVQGLHQIGRNGCAHLRCFECPIAELAVRYEGLNVSG